MLGHIPWPGQRVVGDGMDRGIRRVAGAGETEPMGLCSAGTVSPCQCAPHCGVHTAAQTRALLELQKTHT